MNRLYAGLIIATIIGVAVALFPFYADTLAPHLWTFPEDSGEEEEATTTIEGMIEEANVEGSWILVNGKHILVRGTWTVETSNGTLELESADLIQQYLQPGTHVKVVCKESGRWGLMAEEIEGPDFQAYKEG